MPSEMPGSSRGVGARDITITAHTEAIEGAIQAMHSHLHEVLTLDDLAAVACLSPAHFNRVFRRLIGVPPIEYLTALRFQRARHMLLMTSLRITDICFEVGYTSTSSFTSRFTQLVGLSPHLLRKRAHAFEPLPGAPAARPPMEIVCVPGRQQLVGQITAPATFQGTIYVGLFSSPIPQGKPLRCTTLSSPGRYLLPNVADGIYYLRAAAFPFATEPLASLLPADGLLVGNNPGWLLIQGGRVFGEPNLSLHSPGLCDPPLVMGLPLISATPS